MFKCVEKCLVEFFNVDISDNKMFAIVIKFIDSFSWVLVNIKFDVSSFCLEYLWMG